MSDYSSLCFPSTQELPPCVRSVRCRGSTDTGRALRISKLLARVLRHKALEWGLEVSDGGLVRLDELLRLREFTRFQPLVKLSEVRSIVEQCDKQRYAIETVCGIEMIRANQGHSFEVHTLKLKSITAENVDDYPTVIHGTYLAPWTQFIKTDGLSRMKRQHIHFAAQEFDSRQTISGIRKSCQVLIYLDLPLAIANQLKFWESENGVILSEGDPDGMISPTYFKEVLRVSDRKSLLDLTHRPDPRHTLRGFKNR